MKKVTRRELMVGLAANAVIVNAHTAKGTQANSAVSFGIIGTGGRGCFVGKLMTRDPRARLVAICDIYQDRIDKAVKEVPGAATARVFKDYHELLQQKDVDAVLIATPVFLHPEHFEAAVNAGKHIYCEKPAGADVAGVKRLMQAGESADKSKVIQFGFQQRFSPEYLSAESRLRNGDLGEMTLMISYWVWGGSAFRDAQASPYPPEERKIRHWGAYKETSGDFIVEQDCHGVDILNWFSEAHPLTAYGDGGRKARKFGDNSDHVCVIYEYPDELKGWLIGTQLPPSPYWDVKEQFFGTKGVIEVERSYNSWFQAGRQGVEKTQSSREITIDAVEHFYRYIVEGKQFNMAQSSAESTLTSILGRMACELKRKVTWDEMMQSS